MCLYVNNNLNKDFLKRKGLVRLGGQKVRIYKDKDGEYAIFYKMLCYDNTAPYQRMEYKLGWNVSNSRRKPLLMKKEGRIKERQIYKGIHLYSCEKFVNNNEKLIKVKVYLKDIISFGFFSEVVATRVFVRSLKSCV